MFSPLLQSIIDREGYTVVTHDTLDEMAQTHDFVMLFFAGDAARLAESNDVAVVLPELDKALGGNVTPLIVSRDSERELQRRYLFNAFPAIVFLRRGDYLGVLQGILDWADYQVQIPEILSRDPSAPPPFKFPDGCGVAPEGLTH
ncbi:hydrogenase-1 expression HyaE [uncultured Roseibium sp.]|uniref:hydrogenase-1 expression HyaE n=1 Tax=uncultured Roseibium sp. TaxID=1936171 RepID=UPI003216951D